jgi:hypothetical protein
MRQIVAVLAVFALLAPEAATAGPATPKPPVEITWNELGDLAVARRIRTNLPGGTRVEGEVLAVRPNSLVLDITRSSDRKLYPRGQAEIPRAGIEQVWLLRDGPPVFRVLLAVGSGVGGYLGIAYGTWLTDSLAFAVTGLVLLLPLSIIGGYYAGKAIDRRSTRIQILPDAPRPLQVGEARP